MAGLGVISYNMSVFSAMGDKETLHASEYSFLRRAEVTPGQPTDFFMNALKDLSSTATRIQAKVIGIQEFHPPTLDMIMGKLNTMGKFKYHAFSKEIMNKAAVLTIWDTELGDIEGEPYQQDLIFRPDGTLIEGLGLAIKKQLSPTVILPMDEGRPISIIKTTKGYTLINFHGINRPKYKPDGTETFLDNSAILKTLIAEHCKHANVGQMDPNKIIIMCDSNDREHGINRANPLMIETKGGLVRFHDGNYPRDGAVSCCYNWDSCGVKPNVIPEPAKSTKPFPGKLSLDATGAEKEYKYTGDYILSANFITPVTAEESNVDPTGASISSDHKLVYAILPMPMAGGRRKMRKTRKSKERKL